MKKLFIRITSIIIVMSFILSVAPLLSSTIYAAEDMSFKKIGEDIYTYNKNKEFVVTLSTPIDESSVNENSVYIRTNENNVVLVNSQVDEADNTKIKIKPPSDGYKKDIRYTIYVKNLRSKKGTQLKENVKQSFMYVPGSSKKNDESFSDEKGKIKPNVVEVNDSDKFVNDIKATNVDVDGTEKLKLTLPQESSDEKPEPGKVLVIKPNNEFLNGLAIKTESVKEENGNYVIVGKTPEIQEVFENLEIKDDVNIAEYIKNNENISLIEENGKVKGYEFDEDYLSQKLKENFGDESNSPKTRGRRVRRSINYEELKPSMKFESLKVHLDIDTSKKTLEVYLDSSIDFKLSHGIEMTEKIDKKIKLTDQKTTIPLKPPFKVNIIIKSYIEFTAKGELRVKVEIERKVGFKLGKRFKAESNSFEDINEVTNKKNISFNAGASCTIDVGPVLEVRMEITAFEANILLVRWKGVTIVSTTGRIALKAKFDANGNIGLNISDDGVKTTINDNVEATLDVKIYIPVSLAFEFDCIKLIGGEFRIEAYNNEFLLYHKKLSSTGNELSGPSEDNISDETLLNITDEEIREMFKDENVLQPSSNHLMKVTKFDKSTGTIEELEMPSAKPAILYLPEDIEGVRVRRIKLSRSNLGTDYSGDYRYNGDYYQPGSFNKDGTIERVVLPDTIRDIDYIGRYEIKNIKLPSSLYRIGEGAFVGCKLKKINLPYSIGYIEKYAFNYNELENIEIPDSIVTIEPYAFANNKLKKIKLPSKLHKLDGFSGNKNLKNITIPNSVIEIRDYAFLGCDIRELNIPSNVTRIGERAFGGNENLKDVTIPNSVMEIRYYAFLGCDIRELNIPYGVRYLNGFAANYGLRKVTIPNSVEVIGSSAFNDCDLRDITIPSSVREIGSDAFGNNKNLLNVTIPGNVKKIGDYAFSSCRNLRSITIEEGVKEIGQSAFGATDIREVVIPNSVEKIGNYAFYGCRNLKSIVLKEGVREIGDGAFGATDIREVVIPNSVQKIGDRVFRDTPIKKVEIPESLANIAKDVFPSDCKIIIRSN